MFLPEGLFNYFKNNNFNFVKFCSKFSPEILAPPKIFKIYLLRILQAAVVVLLPQDTKNVRIT